MVKAITLLLALLSLSSASINIYIYGNNNDCSGTPTSAGFYHAGRCVVGSGRTGSFMMENNNGNISFKAYAFNNCTGDFDIRVSYVPNNCTTFRSSTRIAKLESSLSPAPGNSDRITQYFASTNCTDIVGGQVFYQVGCSANNTQTCRRNEYSGEYPVATNIICGYPEYRIEPQQSTGSTVLAAFILLLSVVFSLF
eukprot:TRINITY_DN15241_c0_g1_i1.p1 TRINITY_DN15241_c0_g1~~TRINITY_DN15241_c0_g1_i1.p1  ORF type:complete len:196 (-),score=23.60 TRINITY_DN15241_c0_g1_i1:143-730(-)